MRRELNLTSDLDVIPAREAAGSLSTRSRAADLIWPRGITADYGRQPLKGAAIAWLLCAVRRTGVTVLLSYRRLINMLPRSHPRDVYFHGPRSSLAPLLATGEPRRTGAFSAAS